MELGTAVEWSAAIPQERVRRSAAEPDGPAPRAQAAADLSARFQAQRALNEAAQSAPRFAVQRALSVSARSAPRLAAQRGFLKGPGASDGGRPGVVQLKSLTPNRLNVAGENHADSGAVREQEAAYARTTIGGVYKQEGEFRTSKWALGQARLGDPLMLRAEMLLALLREKTWPEILAPFGRGEMPPRFQQALQGRQIDLDGAWTIFRTELTKQFAEIMVVLADAISEASEAKQAGKAKNFYSLVEQMAAGTPHSRVGEVATDIIPGIKRLIGLFATDVLNQSDIRPEVILSAMRSAAMQQAAADDAAKLFGGQVGVWKVGEDHVAQIGRAKQGAAYELLTKDDFDEGFNKWRQTRMIRRDALDDNWEKLTEAADGIGQPEAHDVIKEKRIRARMSDPVILGNTGAFVQFNIEMLSLIEELPRLVEEKRGRQEDLLLGRVTAPSLRLP